MSWIVESLLLNRHNIREEFNPFDETYSDLLVVETKAEDLINKGIIDEFETLILNSVIEAKSFNEVAKDLNLSKWTISKYFHQACNKISYYLGGAYTNIGYSEYIRNKYKLNEEQEHKMVEYMKSKYKHKLLSIKDDEGEDYSE